LNKRGNAPLKAGVEPPMLISGFFSAQRGPSVPSLYLASQELSRRN